MRVSYVGIEEPLPDLERSSAYGYAFRWTLPGDPAPGRRVIVKGSGGQTGGVVIGTGRGDWDGPLEPIVRGLSEAEQRRAFAAEEAFFAACRRAVGLKADGRKKVRQGWPEIAPAKGKATAAEAGKHGRVWWRIYKMSERYARPDEEIKAFAAAAHRWFAIRDRG